MAVSLEKSMAMAQDLQSFICFVEENGPEEVLRASREVDSAFDACAIVWKLENEGQYPTVILHNIKGSSHAARPPSARCRDKPPPVEDKAPGHQAACWLR